MTQSEWMDRHHKLNDKIRDIENKISVAKSERKDWRYMYERQLADAQHQANLAYELATDRGF